MDETCKVIKGAATFAKGKRIIHDIPKTPGPSDYARVEKLDFRSRSPCATISEGTKRFDYLPDPSVPGPSDY